MLIHGIGALSTVYIFNKYRQKDLIQAKTILADDVVAKPHVEIKDRGHYVIFKIVHDS